MRGAWRRLNHLLPLPAAEPPPHLPLLSQGLLLPASAASAGCAGQRRATASVAGLQREESAPRASSVQAIAPLGSDGDGIGISANTLAGQGRAAQAGHTAHGHSREGPSHPAAWRTTLVHCCAAFVHGAVSPDPFRTPGDSKSRPPSFYPLLVACLTVWAAPERCERHTSCGPWCKLAGTAPPATRRSGTCKCVAGTAMPAPYTPSGCLLARCRRHRRRRVSSAATCPATSMPQLCFPLCVLQRGRSGVERRRVDPVLKEVSRVWCRPPAAVGWPTWCWLSVPGLPCDGHPAMATRLSHASTAGLPTRAQAHKRGLDVEQLHDSRTPAWRNLRGRSASRRKQSYYEGPEQGDEDDELEDQISGSEGGQEEEEEEEPAGDGSSDEVRGRRRGGGSCSSRERWLCEHAPAAAHASCKGGGAGLVWLCRRPTGRPLCCCAAPTACSRAAKRS